MLKTAINPDVAQRNRLRCVTSWLITSTSLVTYYKIIKNVQR
jgi:hypothetical protein